MSDEYGGRQFQGSLVDDCKHSNLPQGGCVVPHAFEAIADTQVLEQPDSQATPKEAPVRLPRASSPNTDDQYKADATTARQNIRGGHVEVVNKGFEKESYFSV